MKCSFCDAEIEPGTGILVVDKTGKILPFNSKKCEKNMLKLKRNPRKYKWAKGSE